MCALHDESAASWRGRADDRAPAGIYMELFGSEWENMGKLWMKPLEIYDHSYGKPWNNHGKKP